MVIVIIAALVIGLFGFLAFDDNSDSSTDVSAGSSTTAVRRTPSPAARPRRASRASRVADPLPAGAPEVPSPSVRRRPSSSRQDLVVGTGATVEASSTITVDYIGVSCSTGKIFDTSYGSAAGDVPAQPGHPRVVSRASPG